MWKLEPEKEGRLKENKMRTTSVNSGEARGALVHLGAERHDHMHTQTDGHTHTNKHTNTPTQTHKQTHTHIRTASIDSGEARGALVHLGAERHHHELCAPERGQVAGHPLDHVDVELAGERTEERSSLCVSASASV